MITAVFIAGFWHVTGKNEMNKLKNDSDGGRQEDLLMLRASSGFYTQRLCENTIFVVTWVMALIASSGCGMLPKK